MTPEEIDDVVARLRVAGVLINASDRGLVESIVNEYGMPERDDVAGWLLPLASAIASKRPTAANMFAMCLLRRLSGETPD